MGQKISHIFSSTGISNPGTRDFSQNLVFARVNSVRDSRHPRFFSNTFFARVHSGRIPVLEIVFRFCYLQRVFLKKKKNPGTALPKIPVPGFFVFWKNPGTGDFFVRVPGFFFPVLDQQVPLDLDSARASEFSITTARPREEATLWPSPPGT